MARILEDEIAGDPTLQGYDGMNDTELLVSLNAKTLSRNRKSMTGREVNKAVDVAEYNALTDAKKQQFIELMKRDDLDLFGLDRDILIDIFGGGSTTVSNLAVERVETISRGVEIGWGLVRARDFRLHTLTRATPNPDV